VRLELQLAATEIKHKAAALGLGIALLAVTGGLFLHVAVLAVRGIAKIRKGTPPVPVQAIEEAKLTTEALKNGHH
jgi:hypothetical protein